MLIVLPQVFPDGLLPGRGWVAVLVASLVIQVPTVVYSAHFEYLYDLVRWEDEKWVRAQSGVDLVMPQATEVVLWNAPLWVAGLVAVATLLVRWRRGSTLVRQQIGWLVAAGLITAVLTTIGWFRNGLFSLKNGAAIATPSIEVSPPSLISDGILSERLRPMLPR